MKNINDINFLDDVGEKRKINSAPIVYGLFGFVICLVGINYLLNLSSEINDLTARSEELNSVITDKNNQVAEMKKLISESKNEVVEGEEKAPDTYMEDLSALSETMLTTYSPLNEKVVGDIENASVEGTFYVNYEINDTYFIIRGYAQNSNQAANLAYNLRQSDYIEDVTINFLTLVAEMDTTKSLAYDLYEFEITGSITGGEGDE